jgi:hypothetical protein
MNTQPSNLITSSGSHFFGIYQRVLMQRQCRTSQKQPRRKFRLPTNFVTKQNNQTP